MKKITYMLFVIFGNKELKFSYMRDNKDLLFRDFWKTKNMF